MQHVIPFLPANTRRSKFKWTRPDRFCRLRLLFIPLRLNVWWVFIAFDMSDSTITIYHPDLSDDHTLQHVENLMWPWKMFISEISGRRETVGSALKYGQCTQYFARDQSGIKVVKYAELISFKESLLFNAPRLMAKYRAVALHNLINCPQYEWEVAYLVHNPYY